MVELFRLRPWLTLDEAARFVSNEIGSSIEVGELLRLSLDGHLLLSVNLPKPQSATFRSGEGEARRTTTGFVEGVWDILMEGAGRLEVDCLWHYTRRDYTVHLDGRTGAMVRQGDVVCQLPPQRGESGLSPHRSSALPYGSTIVIRMPELVALAGQLSADVESETSTDTDKPLATRERDMLLTIIAALADEAGIDMLMPAKAAAVIVSRADQNNTPISQRAVANHINKAAELIGRRPKK